MKSSIQNRSIYAVLSIALAVVLFCHADTCTDEELRHDVLEFLTTRCCGRVEARRVLTNEIRFDGDTNRLACVLAEFAQPNDAQIAEWAMWQLEKYATSAQLPFLYSCATNPVLGKTAVESVLRIEGVTSNSLAVAQSYVSLTNGFPLMNTDDRPDVCRSIVTKVFADDTLVAYRPYVMDIACSFAKDVNVLPKGLDKTLVSLAPDFRMTKRRLAILRSAGQRVEEKFYSADTNAVHYSIEAHIYDVQTNYLANAINELVAYPEADLPD